MLEKEPTLIFKKNQFEIQLVINGNPVVHMYDRDIGGRNNRYAMVSQSGTRYNNFHSCAVISRVPLGQVCMFVHP